MAKKQPNWKFTPRRQASLKKAQKTIAKMKDKANIAVVTDVNRKRLRKTGL